MASKGATPKLSVDFNNPVIIGVISVIVLFITVLIWLWSRRKQARTSVLLTGLSESGKTLIFAHLLHSQFRQTHTSITENVGDYQINNSVLKIVDIPGQERVRGQIFDKYKGATRGLVYVIDSSTLQKDIRDVAEYLYILLSDPAINKISPSILILCNKQDLPLAKGSQVILSLLEKEINLVRHTKSSQLQSVDPSHADNTTFLGKKDKDFKFSHLNTTVQFAESSSIDESDEHPVNLEELSKWIQGLP